MVGDDFEVAAVAGGWKCVKTFVDLEVQRYSAIVMLGLRMNRSSDSLRGKS